MVYVLIGNDTGDVDMVRTLLNTSLPQLRKVVDADGLEEPSTQSRLRHEDSIKRYACVRFVQAMEDVRQIGMFLFSDLPQEYVRLCEASGEYVPPPLTRLRWFWEWYEKEFVTSHPGRRMYDYVILPNPVLRDLEKYVQRYSFRYRVRPLAETINGRFRHLQLSGWYDERRRSIEQIWQWAWDFSRLPCEPEALLSAVREMQYLLWHYYHTGLREYLSRLRDFTWQPTNASGRL